jgi:hypothetical protein
MDSVSTTHIDFYLSLRNSVLRGKVKIENEIRNRLVPLFASARQEFQAGASNVLGSTWK